MKRHRKEWRKHDVTEPYGPRLLHSGYVIPGREPNYKGARKIHLLGTDIRVFPHEFSVLNRESIQPMVYGYDQVEPSHQLVPESVGDHASLKKLKESVFYLRQRGLTKPKAEALILEGLGYDMSSDMLGVPALGWYRVNVGYGLAFCTLDELKILYPEEGGDL